MPRRITVVPVAVVGLCLVAAAPAAATERVVIRGGTTFNPGESIVDNVRFTPRNLTVSSGERVRVRDRGTDREAPHTLSIVRRGQLPNSFNCRACEQLFVAHEVNEEEETVGKPRVNVGAPGFNRPGDSILIPPGGRVSFRVTADEGRNLSYLCAIHPWMQGQFNVR